MPTRAAAAKEAAFIASSVDTGNEQAVKPNLKTAFAVSKRLPKDKKGVQKEQEQVLENEDVAIVNGEGPASSATGKRKRTTAEKTNGIVNGELVQGGWDELPHNMGSLAAAQEDFDLTEKPLVKRPKRVPSAKKESASKGKRAIKKEAVHTEQHGPDENGVDSTGAAVKLESELGSEEIKQDPIVEELKDENEVADAKPKKKRATRVRKLKVDESEDILEKVDELLETVDKPAKKVKKGKKNPYGLTPGETPYPDFAMPTVEACQEVNDLLAELHGKVVPPKEIPAPSLEVTGCGEVPSVLDALIRTRLSAATTSKNSGYAFEGLVKRYGILEEGIGAGSVNWNAVRESPVEDIEKAILRGGLAKSKSKSIKTILEMVHQHNVERYESFVKERDNDVSSEIEGAAKLTKGQKDLEIVTREKGVLSLDYMHGLTPEVAMTEFTRYPGIGVKTASCVILFCLRRPSFAVDTHVFRLCKWLKWVPENATRDTSFSHLEVRVPNELKYPLHQLFIRHGKTCGRCRAATGEGGSTWETTVCPIEHLVTRSGKRKGKVAVDSDDEGIDGEEGAVDDEQGGQVGDEGDVAAEQSIPKKKTRVVAKREEVDEDETEEEIAMEKFKKSTKKKDHDDNEYTEKTTTKKKTPAKKKV